ncbi:unnamed protein product [Mycena citricolor]|uniref:Uncharacterized protein n=1 Tax=Mycena citricolor TaxID=2018698 RepID=A0AAD2Q3K0_9AGAR|nr:unnamed protein product [Mycena citricolor]
MGLEHIHIGRPGAPYHPAKPLTPKVKRDSTTPDPSCATGAFYTSPTLGATVDAMSPLNIVWNTGLDCLQPAPSSVDIYLYAPGSATSRMHMWQGVSYASGNYSATLMPRWWNSTSSATLQLMIVSSGTPPFLSTLPSGPVIQATYTPSSNGTTPDAANTAVHGSPTTIVGAVAGAVSGVSSHTLSPGKKAAAVILPLLFCMLIGATYLKLSRARGKAKRAEWSEKIDKRMSTISTDWKSITAGGAKEAVRHSIAIGRNSSAFSVGSVRPSNVEGEPVFMGEQPVGRGSIDIDEKDTPRTSLGSGIGVGVGARRPKTSGAPPDRGSRAVSFAETAPPRPSISSNGPRTSAYSRTSRAFHTASTYADWENEGDGMAPPVPALPTPPSPSMAGVYGSPAPRPSVDSSRSVGSGRRTGNSLRGSNYSANRTTGFYSNSSHDDPTPALPANTVFSNPGAWTSGERVPAPVFDGQVSPTGRVHNVNYPSTLGLNSYEQAYGDEQNSYFSPATPTPQSGFVVEPTADSAYGSTTYGEFSSPDMTTSPRQTAGPLTLTPDDIRRRMTLRNAEQGQWRQSVEEVFGALSMMRTGENGEDEAGEYLFAPETVFAYPGTPAPASGFNGALIMLL